MMRAPLLLLSLSCSLLTAVYACSSEPSRAPRLPPGSGGGDESAGGAGGAVLMPVNNCGDEACEGEGATCVESSGKQTCQCAPGYLREAIDDGYECVVDRSCVKLRYLESGCRVQLNGAPAVGLFFGADYCAGTAVLPEDIGDLGSAFHIQEDGKELTVEAEATIVSRDVESFVGVVLDVSESVQEDPALLRQLTSELRAFVDALESSPGKPPVTISLMVFAKEFGVLVPFTTSTAVLKEKLEELEERPLDAITPALANYTGEARLDGTSLWLAVEKGIKQIERIQQHRNLATDNGVLTSGTLVVITDGEDTNNQTSAPSLSTTLVNLISLGVSPKIRGATLSAVGRDGAFLATTEDSRSLAFASIAERVKRHPERTYLLGYCSAASTGAHTVSITLADSSIETTPASCGFDAGIFGGLDCSSALFASACDQAECGTMFACGACANDSCCSDGTCAIPTPATDCRGVHSMCAEGQRCAAKTGTNPVEYECVTALPLGGDCSGANVDLCAEGTRCDGTLSVCVGPDRPTGASCMGPNNTLLSGTVCEETSNCQRFNSTSAYCDVDAARAYDACSTNDGNAVCPKGTHCSGVCLPKLPNGLYACTADAQCGSGYCSPTTKLCAGNVCSFSWNDALDQ